MLKHMRTSVEISDSLLRKARNLARRRHTTLRQLIEEGLGRLLQAERTPNRPKLQDFSYGEGGLLPGLNSSDWDTIQARAFEGRGA